MEIHSVNSALLGLKPWGSEQAVIMAFRCELPHAELADNCNKVGEQVSNVRDLRKAGSSYHNSPFKREALPTSCLSVAFGAREDYRMPLWR